MSRFGLLLLGITAFGNVAVLLLGDFGFYVVSFVGGAVSSASTAATAAAFATQGKLSTEAAAMGVLLSSVASAFVHVPMFWRAIDDPRSGRRLLYATLATVAVGALAMLGEAWLLKPPSLALGGL